MAFRKILPLHNLNFQMNRVSAVVLLAAVAKRKKRTFEPKKQTAAWSAWLTMAALSAASNPTESVG